jgi:predicted DNA-binding protein with PD1-like motif
LHLHIVVASKKEIVAGHLIEAYVQPTFEVAIFEFNKELKRTIEAKGLTLIDA